MKKLTNFFKNNLTHKILPLFALFLLIFNLFFVSTVNAQEFDYSSVNMDSNVVSYIKNLPKFNDYSYYFCHANNSTSFGSLIEVFLFNDGGVTFSCNKNNGWDSILSSRNFDFYHYILKVDYSSESDSCFISSIIDEKFEDRQINNIITGSYNSSGYPIFSNIDIYTDTSNTSYYYRAFTPPRFGETQESINNLAGGYCLIFPGSVEPDSKIVFKLVSRFGEEGEKDRVVYQTDLTWSSSFYKSIKNSSGILEEFWYEIPYETMYSFEKGQKFTFMLEYSKSADDLNTRVVQLDATIGSITTADKTQDDINSGFNTLNSSISSGFADLKVEFEQSTDKIVEEQQKTQEALKENTETNKNIFQRIGELLSYINPLSENFFAYKLIDLLLNALKSLFIPSDNFFNNWLADLNEYFGDRFGILYYPFEVVIDFLTRFVNACDTMSSSSAVINVPEMKFMGVTLISAFSYDFNSLLVNDTLKTIHDIYLVVMDVMFSLMLVNLAKNTFVEIFGGSFTDEVIGDVREEFGSPSSSSKSYKRYEQMRYNQVYYNSMHKGGNKK